jgi:hypothetical protein
MVQTVTPILDRLYLPGREKGEPLQPPYQIFTRADSGRHMGSPSRMPKAL